MGSMIIANNLKTKRKQLGLTQQLMSDLLNLERSTYAYYETGKTTPSIETLIKLCDMFDCDILEIIRPAEDVVAEESGFTLKKEDTNAPIKVAKRLISKISMLPLKDRLEVEKLVDDLLSKKAK